MAETMPVFTVNLNLLGKIAYFSSGWSPLPHPIKVQLKANRPSLSYLSTAFVSFTVHRHENERHNQKSKESKKWHAITPLRIKLTTTLKTCRGLDELPDPCQSHPSQVCQEAHSWSLAGTLLA